MYAPCPDPNHIQLLRSNLAICHYKLRSHGSECHTCLYIYAYTTFSKSSRVTSVPSIYVFFWDILCYYCSDCSIQGTPQNGQHLYESTCSLFSLVAESEWSRWHISSKSLLLATILELSGCCSSRNFCAWIYMYKWRCIVRCIQYVKCMQGISTHMKHYLECLGPVCLSCNVCLGQRVFL